MPSTGSWVSVVRPYARRIPLKPPPQQQNHERLLGVQAVLRLLKDHGLRAVEHRVRYLGIAMRRQAVHEHGMGRSVSHQRLVHLVRLEDWRSLGYLMLESHAGADVGIYRIGAAHRAYHIVGERQRSPGFRARS